MCRYQVCITSYSDFGYYESTHLFTHVCIRWRFEKWLCAIERPNDPPSTFRSWVRLFRADRGKPYLWTHPQGSRCSEWRSRCTDTCTLILILFSKIFLYSIIYIRWKWAKRIRQADNSINNSPSTNCEICNGVVVTPEHFRVEEDFIAKGVQPLQTDADIGGRHPIL